MDLDSFLAAPKWDILKIISEKPSSPIEIADITKTTVSYVSQQLKLLEARGIVVKTKTGAYEKGKPRNVYSISHEFAHVSLLTHGFSDKKKILLDDHKKILLKIWLLENSLFHFPLEKFFVLIDDVLDLIGAIDCKQTKLNVQLTFYVTDKKAISEIKLVAKSIPLIACLFEPLSALEKNSREALYSLYENSDILNRERGKDMKGGSKR